MDVIVIGAGAAGLAASCKLARAGLRVTVLEGRSRIGGRVYTVPNGTRAPFELGAEFIHGSRNAVTELCRRARLKTFAARDRHWNYAPKSGLSLEETLWDKLEKCLETVRFDQPDLSFEELLQTQSLARADKRMLRLFVEGFDAADTTLISSQSLAKAQEETDDKSLRIERGYVRLIDWLREKAGKAGVEFRLSTVAQTVAWRKDAVEIAAQTPVGRHIFRTPRVIITLPLGVLKAGTVRFIPDLAAKQEALSGLEMGGVTKMSFWFHSPFWNKAMRSADFGFIHGPQLRFPTWWSRAYAPVLSAWIGGPDSVLLDSNDLLPAALRDLRRIFGVPIPVLRAELLDWRSHDWGADPFSHGAYSYTRAGHLSAPEALGEPIDKTLFFAGEATASGASQGTVHGAIESGFRAAARVLERAMDHRL